MIDCDSRKENWFDSFLSTPQSCSATHTQQHSKPPILCEHPLCQILEGVVGDAHGIVVRVVLVT